MVKSASEPADNSELPAPPATSAVSPLSVRALFVWNDVRGRGPFALRSALCMILPMLIGWLSGHEVLGLIATLGASTGLYGGQHPYHRRAWILGWAAIGFTVAVGLGIMGAVTPWFGAITVALFAGAAVLICNSLNVGPPGGYMFVLACAVGAMIHGKLSIPLWQVLLLVAGGGAIAWCVQMSGYLVFPNGPQRRIVLAAARAVQSYVRALATPGEDAARHFAAMTLQTSLEMLAGTSPDTPYQKLNRRINLLFAATNRRDSASERLTALSDALVSEAEKLPIRRIAKVVTIDEFVDNETLSSFDEERFSSKSWHAGALILDTFFRHYSDVRRTVARVIIASVIAGGLALTLGMNQPFWAIVTAVLVLHQGGGRKLLLQRGWQRLVGTLLGLVLAEIFILLNPQGIWLILVIGISQFIVEVVIVRNYAVGVLFVTPLSLLIAANIIGSYDNLLFARGVDTMIGVAVAYVILFTIATQTGQRRLPEALAETLNAAETSLGLIVTGNVASTELKIAQARLRHRLIDLYNTYNNAINESRETERAITPYWGNVVRTLRLGYKVLLASSNAQDGASLDLSRIREQIETEKERCLHMASEDFSREVEEVRQKISAFD